MKAVITANMRQVTYDNWLQEMSLGKIGKTSQCEETEYQVTVRGDLVRSANRKETHDKGPFQGAIPIDFLKSDKCQLYILD